MPWELLELGATAKQLRVFFAVDQLARDEGQPWCIAGTRELERLTGMPEVTCRHARDWWVEKGLFVLDRIKINGTWRSVIHCPWLMESSWAGVVIEFGQGVGFDVDKGRTVTTAKPSPKPRSRATVPFEPACATGDANCASGGAPPTAPKSKRFPEAEKSNASRCVAALAFGEDSEAQAAPVPTSEPIPPEPIAPPPPAPPDPAKVADLVATLRSSPPTDRVLAMIHPTTVRLAYHELVTLGADLVPTDLAVSLAEQFGAPPPPEPVRVKVETPPAPTTTKALIYRLADPTGPDARDQAMLELSTKLGGEFRCPPKSLAKNLQAVVDRKVSAAGAWEAYQHAVKPGARAPGAVWNQAMNRMRERSPG